jgi:hypothetical protein
VDSVSFSVTHGPDFAVWVNKSFPSSGPALSIRTRTLIPDTAGMTGFGLYENSRSARSAFRTLDAVTLLAAA